jgi:hypothetical protein
MPYSNLALDADRENGPAARSFAADAHDCIMVRIKRSYRIQVCGTKIRPQWRAPLGSSIRRTDRHRPEPKLCKSPSRRSSSLRVLRRQGAAKHKAPLRRQAAKLCYRFGPLTPSARSANLIAGDGTKNGFPGRVEDWRASWPRYPDRATFPAPSTSHAACGFPALRAPICFTSGLMGPIIPGQLSVRRVALDSC